VPVELQVRSTVAIVVGLLVLALLGGLVSIWRVLRIDPIRATVSTGRTL
jgi:ABC-type antimicrobial peptide transport system permease subunit